VLIRSRLVKLNGKICLDPETPTSLAKDRIEIDDGAILPAEMVYVALNKPRGVITTASDEKGRITVYSGLSKDLPWVSPVGRLDKASEGLLLLTNDSEWAARVSAPETHLEKTYHVQVGIIAQQPLLASMMEGIEDRGESLRVKSARRLRSGRRNSWIEVVLDEGRNRHIRRLLERLEVPVLRLVRVAIGPLPLGRLAKGTSRTLTGEEKRLLDGAMRMNR
jgi:23S rRNA pseudouridine2605 synthase